MWYFILKPSYQRLVATQGHPIRLLRTYQRLQFPFRSCNSTKCHINNRGLSWGPKLQNISIIPRKNLSLSRTNWQQLVKDNKIMNRSDVEAGKVPKISRSTRKELTRLIGLAKQEKWTLVGMCTLHCNA